jgi:hypothetical protein
MRIGQLVLGFTLATFAPAIGSAAAPSCASIFSAENAPVQTKKTKFELYDRTYSAQVITPEGNHYLNQLAVKAGRDLNGLKLIYAEGLLDGVGANAAYAFKQNVVLIPASALSDKAPSHSLEHELVHARVWKGLRAQEDFVFTGIAYNSKPAFQGRQYGPAFGIDEVVATTFSVQYHLLRMKAELARTANSQDLNALSGVMDSMNDARVYTARLTTMLTTLGLGLQSGHKKERISTPEELNFLPQEIQWQEVSVPEIQLYIPVAGPKDRLKIIADYSNEAIPILAAADRIGAKLQVSTAASDQQVRQDATAYISAIEKMIQLFQSRFPTDAATLAD